MNQQEDQKMPQKRIIATFILQERVGDNAMEIDGGCEVDVTDKVLALPALKIGGLSDYHDTTDVLVDAKELGHDGPFAVVVEQSVREFFGVANLSSDITDEIVAAARAARGLSTDGKVPQTTGEFPVLFEIDPDSNEATGTVMPFCSPACRDACGGAAYPGFRKAKEGTSRLSDFGYDPQCEECGVDIKSIAGISADPKLPAVIHKQYVEPDRKVLDAACAAVDQHAWYLNVEGDHDTKVRHLLASLHEYCAVYAVDLDAQLAEARRQILSGEIQSPKWLDDNRPATH